MKVGGYVIDDGGNRVQFPTYSNPSAEQVLTTLELAKDKVAVVGMKVIPEPEVGPYHLTVETEGGKYFVSLQEYSLSGENDVRTLTGASADGDRVDIFGDTYDSASITTEFQIIKEIFLEFLAKGDVSRALLS